MEDLPAALALWSACGLHPSRSDTEAGFRLKLARDPDLFLVAEAADGTLAGTVLGSWDGRRGWINRLAVAPEWRGTGLAQRLMAEVEARLAARGCDKVNLLIEADNPGVQGFYAALGYRRDELIFMEKWLAPARS
jgi:ribosomal protein S18 acetylase RimI-like enzyme